jgi:hypothetical protein
MAERPAPAFDPRITPARPDLAATRLAGKVEAARFVEGRAYEVAEPQAPLRRAPSPDAPLATEALKGERVMIYDMNEEGWAWGQLETDGYVGFMPASGLREPGPALTHKVTALRTLVFPGPSTKLPPIESLSLGCRLAVARIDEPFAVTASGGYAPERHLASIDETEADFIAVGERFLGAPYLWGGKTNLGIDCSGLVQIALMACGISCPRDSDLQETALGEPVALSNAIRDLRRGDLLFWRGHVAIVRDEVTLLHANAHHMAVAIEPIVEAIARIRAAGSEITGVRRLDLPLCSRR